MDKKEKTVRLVDVSELEADLKKDLAEEEAKGKVADVLYCESISSGKSAHHRPEDAASCCTLGRNSRLVQRSHRQRRLVVSTSNSLHKPGMQGDQPVQP